MKSYPYLNALYNGRYQKRNEHGVNMTICNSDNMNMPKPPEPPVHQYRAVPNMFANNVAMYTAQ